MAEAAPQFITRLLPEDEYPHDPGTVKNYNESMYFNVFDAKAKMGGWFRIGNRPNEQYAEMTICLYLPDGRVVFQFGRPRIEGNTEMNAGGLKIEVLEPFKKLRLTYSGKAVMLDRPKEMADPRSAFKENPHVPVEIDLEIEGVSPMYGGQTVRADGTEIDLEIEGVSPMYGGQTVRADGTEIEVDPEKSFAKAHYEQHTASKGHFTIDGVRHEIDGVGLRDKSWGPRHWQAIDWYRWCPLNFGRDFGMMLSVIGDGKGGARQGGMVFRDGIYDHITECVMDSDWDEHGYQTALRAKVKTRGGKSYEVTGKVMSLIPLRNRRTTPDGVELQTRITEGMTEYRCGDLVGYGLSEYLDQIVDGKPNGKEAGY